MAKSKNKIKLITYNIDGLPETLDLNTLPTILKPISFIYKLFKKTTLITINDGDNKKENLKKIGEYLNKENPDIVGVQEDFNFHDELMVGMANYKSGTHGGNFDLSTLFSSKHVDWLSSFPLPRFKADGINILYNKNVELLNEDIQSWDKSYGYIGHANDKLTHKGFRYYPVMVNGTYQIDVYVLHMDADFYHPEKCPDVSKDVEARKCQLQQLVEYIKSNCNHYCPIIIMGDTNSTEKYEWDKNNINNELIDPINKTGHLSIQEAIPTNYIDVDRIFYINDNESKYYIELDECHYDLKAERMSDHKPFIASFNIIDKK